MKSLRDMMYPCTEHFRLTRAERIGYNIRCFFVDLMQRRKSKKMDGGFMMAGNVVSKYKGGVFIIKCHYCKALYTTSEPLRYGMYFENCPICDASHNDMKNTIPLWKYNLIKAWRKIIG